MSERAEKVLRLAELAKQLRLDALDMALAAESGGSHVGGSLSCVEILAVLYGEILHFDVKNPLDPNRDRFLPSKNHCVLAHIPALAAAGFFPREEILQFQKDGGRLTGYPRRPEIGLEYSGGSLGMALSVGIGMALAAQEEKRPSQIYVLLGDGELNEGSVWEAFMAAAHYGLENLTAVIDRNRLSYDGDTETVMGLECLNAKLSSFGWHVSQCDGHDIWALLEAFQDTKAGRPHAILAETVKGKGVSFAEHRPEWHHHRLSQEEYDRARKEVLGETL